MKELIDTWHIHDRINQYLINAIDENNLKDISASKGRNVWEQFAHIHNVRLMWLKAAAPDLHASQVKIEKDMPRSKNTMAEMLKNSGEAIAKLLEKAFTEGKIKNFKPHPTAFLGYLISHESHHRGQIILALKQSGHPIDQKTGFGMWEWGIR